MSTFNDGGLPFGGELITFSSAGAIICTNITDNQKSQEIKVYDQNRAPLGRIVTTDFFSANGTGLLRTTSSSLPTIGETFTHTISGSAVTFTVDDVQQTKGNSANTTFTFTGTQKIN